MKLSQQDYQVIHDILTDMIAREKAGSKNARKIDEAIQALEAYLKLEESSLEEAFKGSEFNLDYQLSDAVENTVFI